MEIEKKVSEKGKVEIFVDGEPVSGNTSRKLTGTTNEESFWDCGGCRITEKTGIFNKGKEVTFWFGDFSREFKFPEDLPKTLPVEEYASILVDRIERVKNWVQECRDTAGTIKELPEITQKLAKEGRLYYRTLKGEIKSLD